MSLHSSNRSTKSKAKFREKMKGRPTWMKGRKWTDEERAKISVATKKAMENLSEEKRKRMSEANKGSTAWVGRHHTTETKVKISAAGLGRKQSEETNRKRAEKLRGHRHTEESKRLMSEHSKGKNLGRVPWNKGKKLDEETKAKISKSLKGNNNRIKNKAAQ